jgi:hypothetical protein
VLAAGVAELGKLQPASSGLLVLGGGVVPVLARGTLQGDDLAHWVVLLYIELASHLGWQAACRSGWTLEETSRLTRRDTGLIGPCCQILNCASGGLSGQATLVLLLLSTKTDGKKSSYEDNACLWHTLILGFSQPFCSKMR